MQEKTGNEENQQQGAIYEAMMTSKSNKSERRKRNLGEAWQRR